MTSSVAEEALYCVECVTKHNPKMMRYDLEGKKEVLSASEMVSEALDEASICDPGKFEGEHISTYHAFHISMEGGDDDFNGPYSRVGDVIIYHSDQGFVYGEVYDSEEAAIEAFNEKIAPLCFDDECEEEHSGEGKHLD